MITLLIATLDQTAQPAPESPRLVALAAELVAGRREALEHFWAERKTEGTPIYEPGPDPRHTRVTFVWRGEIGRAHV